MEPFTIIGFIITTLIIISTTTIIIIKCTSENVKVNAKTKTKTIECSDCGTDRMSENYSCVRCKQSWCKVCIDHCLEKSKADWVLRDGLSDMCAKCRPTREMSLPKPTCFNCEELVNGKTLQCKTCFRTYCKNCKYESLNATNDGCVLCTEQDEKWKRKSSAKAICISCDRSYDKLYQCGECKRTYCKYCNYKINNDTCWDCIIVI